MSDPASDDGVRYEQAAGVATITIDRPASLNAVTLATLGALAAAFDRVRDEGTARAVLFTGAGRAFSSGADLAGFAAGGAVDADRGAGLERGFNPVIERMRALPLPIVCAAPGVAAGGGCGLALAADIVIAARSAYFLQPFVNIGLVPDVGATWALPRLIGRARATAMMMLGERVSAEQAAEWGMIWRAVDDEALMPAARGLAERLAAGPTRSYALMRRAIADAAEGSLSDALAAERRDQRLAGLTADHQEGVAAFLGKRRPAFEGR